MVFTSFAFMLFFLFVIVAYYLTPMKWRWLTLLAANYYFYISIKPVFALVLIGVTATTYLFGRLIDLASTHVKRKLFMQVGVALVFMPLFFFKYFSCLNNGLLTLFNERGLLWPLPQLQFILPIGISFYTFMAVSYLIDVYYEEIACEHNLGFLALFLSFFPLILSGPIERASNLLPQLRAPAAATEQQVFGGIKLMLWGYFAKIVVADRIGIYVDMVFNNIVHHNGTTSLLAVCLYPFQVYADLGGYSLIAIGVASILGINVIPNFKRPFFATSMSEFWRRWHMSLISWINDYLYTPLAFHLRAMRMGGVVIALMITFAASGLWHGPEMTFVVWGLLQGVFLSIEMLCARRRAAFEKRYGLTHRPLYRAAMMLLTFAMFAISMTFSRAATVADGFQICAKLLFSQGPLAIDRPSTIVYMVVGILMLLAKDARDEFFPSQWLLFNHSNRGVRLASYSALLILIMLIGVTDSGQFIYFQF